MSCFSSLVFRLEMSDEMRDEKGWDFEAFCPCMPRKILGREKIQGSVFSPLTGERNAIFPP